MQTYIEEKLTYIDENTFYYIIKQYFSMLNKNLRANISFHFVKNNDQNLSY